MNEEMGVVPATTKPVEIKVIGEGRITEIDLSLTGTEINWFNQDDPNSPVVITFFGGRHFVRLFDHREKARAIFKQYPNSYRLLFSRLDEPCLGGYRLKGKTQFFVLSDIGTEDMRDGGEEEKLVLTTLPQRRARRVLANAVHPATQICICESR